MKNPVHGGGSQPLPREMSFLEGEKLIVGTSFLNRIVLDDSAERGL